MIEDHDRAKFVKYLTEFNSKISANITKQMTFLSKQERIPICILIRPDLAEQMLQYSIPDSIKIQQMFLSWFSIPGIRVCEVYGMPVYVSIKLSKSILQVVGEIEWK